MQGLKEMIGRILGLGPVSGWRRGPVLTRDGLVRFLAAEAAFTVQKTAYGYCRARAGRQQEKLVSESGFATRMEPCQWETVPVVLADMLLWWLAGKVAQGEDEDSLRRLAPGLYAEALIELGPPPDRFLGMRQQAEAAFAQRLSAPCCDRADRAAAFRPGLTTLLETLPFNRDLVEWDTPQIRHTFRLWLVHHCDRQDRMLRDPRLMAALLIAAEGAVGREGGRDGTGIPARA